MTGAAGDPPLVPAVRPADSADGGYDEEALAEIELASDLMIAANSRDSFDAAELDRVLGLPPSG